MDSTEEESKHRANSRDCPGIRSKRDYPTTVDEQVRVVSVLFTGLHVSTKIFFMKHWLRKGCSLVPLGSQGSLEGGFSLELAQSIERHKQGSSPWWLWSVAPVETMRTRTGKEPYQGFAKKCPVKEQPWVRIGQSGEMPWGVS